MADLHYIAIACDHAGFELKKIISELLKKFGFQVEDLGTNSNEPVDYPDHAHTLAASVEGGNTPYGILICGSANGMAMTANKHPKIRAAVCWNEEVATLARKHNDANVLCLPARFIDTESAKKIVIAFLSVDFEKGRHTNRVDKIPLN